MFVLVILTLVSNLSIASGSLSVNIIPEISGKARLEISNVSEKNISISISNSRGDLVYYHETQDLIKDYNRLYDFSNLDYGVYNVEVKADGTSVAQTLMINKTGLEAGNTVKTTDPVFNFKNNILFLSYLNHNKNEPSMHIYKNGKIVWDQKMENSFTLHKGFDLSNLDRGDYQIVLASGNDIYEYDLEVE